MKKIQTIEQFVELFGDNHFVKCRGKKRVDTKLYSKEDAEEFLQQGFNIGWWIASGFVVVDVDDKGDDKNTSDSLKKFIGETFSCRTSNGYHLYYKTDIEMKQVVKGHIALGVRIDTRVKNKGYVMLPFNTKDREFLENDVQDLPYYMIPLPIKSSSERYIMPQMGDGDGRNDGMLRHLLRLKKLKFSSEKLEQVAKLINNNVFSEPLKQEELDVVIGQVLSYDEIEERDALEDSFYLFNHNGVCTGVNHINVVEHLIENNELFTLGSDVYLYENGLYKESSVKVKNMIKGIVSNPRYCKQTVINEIYKMLVGDIRLVKEDEETNLFPKLINLKNGMYDPYEQRLLPHDPKYYSTIQIPYNYNTSYVDLDMNDLQFFDFLKKTRMPADDINMLLDFVASTLSIENKYKSFMWFVGPSNTGKSTLIRFIQLMVGQKNYANLSIHDVSQRFYPSKLKDKLLNACADNSSLPLKSIANIKKVTGNDSIMHEHKGKEPYFFTPFAKLVFSFNEMPLQLEESSDAFYNRLRILQMTKRLTLTQGYVDSLLSKESIESVLPYLCDRLKGLKEIKQSKESQKAIDNLRGDSDSVYAFLTINCDVTLSPNDTVKKEELYSEYMKFTYKRDMHVDKKMHFNRKVIAFGLKEGRKRVEKERQYVYKGVVLERRENY